MSINTPRVYGQCSVLQRPSFLGGQYRSVTLSKSFQRTERPASNRIVCQLTDKGRSVKPEDIQVRSPIGEGSYGQVFEGWLETSVGRERVVLKRVKNRVEGAAEMGQMEHLLNVYASRSAKDSIAPFVGYSQVQPDEATRSLTEGLWLLWRYEGGKTLAHYLRRRDCIERLAEDLDVPMESVVPTVMRQIFEGLAGLHSAGLVHRDVKPLNIIFADDERRFKLIDLGACADLRTGTNYSPDESILDPTYCPPEQYCMPTDSPHLARQLKPLAIAMSPMLWTRFKPDRFDSFSCGLVLLQLALPKLRSSAGIKSFNAQFKKARYNLQAWREVERPSARETSLLDGNSEAGWKLAAALLRPRDIQVDESGGVVFVNNGGAIRMPVKAALRHKYLYQAKEVRHVRSGPRGTQTAGKGSAAKAKGTVTAPERSAGESSSLMRSALGFWQAASSRLKELEFKLSNQERAVEMQTGKVEVLKADFAEGKVKKEVLDRQEGLLSKMTGRLNSLQSEFGATTANAQRAISFLGPKDRLSNQARAVVKQRERVEVFREDYATGKIKKKDLDRMETVLDKMTNRLGSIQDELNSQAANAQRIFKFLKPKKQEVVNEVAPERPQSSGRRLLNLFLRSDRLESSYQDSSDEDTSQVAGRRRGTGSSGRRSTPDGNVSDSETGSSQRKGFSLFGRGKAEPPTPQAVAPTVRNDLPPSLRQPSGTTDAKASKTEQRSLSQSAAGAAVTGIYAGLRLTGFALRVATDVATSLTRDANTAFAEGEEQRARKRKQRLARNSFLELLRECQPSVEAQSEWQEMRPILAKDARFEELEEEQRAAVFADYTAELANIEESRMRRGEDLFKELLTEAGLTRDSTLSAVEARFKTDRRFGRLPEGLDLNRLFEEAMDVRVPEFDFWDLLRECRNPALNKDVTWGQARRQLVDDPRFNAISERQRRAVFRLYVDGIEEPETAPACLLPTASMNVVVGGKVEGDKDPVAASKESLGALQALRAEQARLKNEYSRMEAKLKDMEKRLLRRGGEENERPFDLTHAKTDINGKEASDLLTRGSGR